MSALSLRIPDSLHQKVKELVKKDHVSINQFITSALAEKTAVFMSREYLETRAAKGNKKEFLKALSKVKHGAPEEHDQL